MVRGAIEEALRWEPPITSVVRVTTRDCQLGETALPAGTNVNVNVAAANRDPRRYPDPDRFDPSRTNIAHLTFGAGPHVCLGMHLARMETAVAINALLDRLPDLRLDPTAPAPSVSGVAFRSPAKIAVEFTPARPVGRLVAENRTYRHRNARPAGQKKPPKNCPTGAGTPLLQP
jgi:cytochrome P450